MEAEFIPRLKETKQLINEYSISSTKILEDYVEWLWDLGRGAQHSQVSKNREGNYQNII